MRELRFEGLSEDGTRLVLVGKDGQRWSVVIDERVEAAVRRDRARLGQVEIEQSGQLRPREIQARIRAGATAEDVAAASGLPLERIRRFEGPVLTERAWIAQQAGQVQMRRASGDVTLAELVSERLIDQGVAGEDITWDAWRPEDGAWLVIANFPLGPNTHVATWRYDTATRTITPADDNAEDLSALPAPAKLRLVTSRPQLTAVTSSLTEDHRQAPERANSTAGSQNSVEPHPWHQQREGSGPEPEDAGLQDVGLQDAEPQDAGFQDAEHQDSGHKDSGHKDSGHKDAVPLTALTGQPADPGAHEPQVQSIDSQLPQIGLAQSGEVESDSDQLEDPQATGVESDSGLRPTPRNLRRNGKRVNRHPSGSQLPAPTPHPSTAKASVARPQPQVPTVPSSDEPTLETAPEPPAKAKPGRTAVPSFDDILFGPAPKH